MKIFRNALIALILFVDFSKFAFALEPVADFKKFCGLTASDLIYKWAFDVEGSGKNIIFLSTDEGYRQERHDDQMPSWTVYLQKEDGRYVKLKGLKEMEGIADISEVQIDRDKMYIGEITQIKKRGMVTIQVDRPRKTAPVAYIYAYTVEGDYFKKTKLAQYNPENGSNLIYDQYLNEAKRTKVDLEKVIP